MVEFKTRPYQDDTKYEANDFRKYLIHNTWGLKQKTIPCQDVAIIMYMTSENT